MAKITTQLTKLLNVDTPIIAAPMAFASTVALATAVTAGGGFGMLGAGFDTSESLEEQLKEARTILSVPDHQPIPIGVGFIGWILDMTEPSDDPRLQKVLAQRPAVAWFAFGDGLGKYIQAVRDYDAKRDHKTIVVTSVNSIAHALRAANEWKVDVIVVQGTEAGGHGGSETPPLFILLQAILKALPNGPPILAAGGIATGAQIASLLTLGASGVVLGTRWLTTPECKYTPQMKSVIQAADLNATTRTLAFDDVGRTNGWPEKHNGRAIVNKVMDDLAEGLTLDERRERFDKSAANGDAERLVIWAGIASGLVDDARPAKDVFEDLRNETVASLKAASSLINA